MGSGSSRKNNDRPIIRTPKKIGTEGASANSERLEKIANECRPGFRVDIVDKKVATLEKAEAILKKEGEAMFVSVANSNVAKLNENMASMVEKCDALGVSYKGTVVVTKEGNVYAEFSRRQK